MFQIQTMNKISPAGLDRFDRAKYTWGDEFGGRMPEGRTGGDNCGSRDSG